MSPRFELRIKDACNKSLKSRCNTSPSYKDLKQNSRGRRRQRRKNNKTNYTRQKAHVNRWNKADIRAVLLSNETSTAPFPRCLQNVADISRTNIHLFVQKETLESTEFQRKRNIQDNQSKDMLSNMRITKKYFFCLRRWRRRPRLLKVPNSCSASANTVYFCGNWGWWDAVKCELQRKWRNFRCHSFKSQTTST